MRVVVFKDIVMARRAQDSTEVLQPRIMPYALELIYAPEVDSYWLVLEHTDVGGSVGFWLEIASQGYVRLEMSLLERLNLLSKRVIWKIKVLVSDRVIHRHKR